jgi:hypothetical protein
VRRSELRDGLLSEQRLRERHDGDGVRSERRGMHDLRCGADVSGAAVSARAVRRVELRGLL